MGLDMYLHIEHSTFDSIYRNDKLTYGEPLDKFITYNDKAVTTKTQYEVAYWRKANAIHNFFDVHCCNGQLENCTDVRVSVEQLETLVHYCKIVLADNTLAEELLPTQDGFFFGSIEYDNWYFTNLQNTIDMCEPIINFMHSLSEDDQLNYKIIYSAWW